MKLKTWHSVSVLFFVVCTAYFFSIHAGYNSVDDMKMIWRLENSGPFDLFHHFFPNGRAYYYRPMTTATYFLDRDLWGTLPSFMHLENILLHYFTSVIVFFTTRLLVKKKFSAKNTVALIAALFFAVHPLASESVCWISGRTDLLAGFLLLLSVWLLLSSLERNHYFLLLFSGFTLLLSCLAKEVAVFALPGLLWIVLVYPGQSANLKSTIRRRCFALAAPVMAIVGYFVMRMAATVRDTGVGAVVDNVIKTHDVDLLNNVRIAFKVYGFYFKKIFIPWPLNFGIIDVSDWYAAFGIVLLVFLIWLFRRRDIFGAFALTAFCVLSPALLISLGKMAWTPIAERYLYVPLALFAPPLAIWVWNFAVNSSFAVGKRYIYPIAVIIGLLFWTTAIHRSWIWQDNERLYRDTVQKSPGFLPAKAELASALQRKGKTEEAEQILESMQFTGTGENYAVDDLNLAAILMLNKEFLKAREILLPLLTRDVKNKNRVYEQLLKLNDKLLSEKNSDSEKSAIREESLHWLLEMQHKKSTPFIAYRIGRLQLTLGDRLGALQSFQYAYKKSPDHAHYKKAAGTIVEKLEKELQ